MNKGRFVLPVILVLMLAGFGYFGWWWNGVAKKVFVSPQKASAATNPAEKSPVQKLIENKTAMNILLLGYGGGDHDGPYLTDTMMVVHLDPVTSRVTLISIPRDLWVNIPTAAGNGTTAKINSAYQAGMDTGNAADGGKLAENVISAVTGLPINYFIGLDFSGFSKTIDTLGGVDVNVEVTFDDPQYPIEGKENDLCGVDPTLLPQIAATASATTDPENIFPCRYEHLHFDAGIAHMDGATALKYVRSRHAAQDGSDFGRSKRQQNLMVAVKQKVLAINFLPKIIPLVNTLGDDVRTDMSPDEARLLIQNANMFGKYKIANLALTDANFLGDSFSSDNQFILVPKAGQNNYSEIQQWIAEQTSQPNPLDPAVVQIENGTKTAGLAQKAVAKLSAQGINTLAPQNAADQTAAQTIMTVYGTNIDEKNIAVIKQEFGNPEVKNAGAAADLKYNVLVVLGLDYTNK